MRVFGDAYDKKQPKCRGCGERASVINESTGTHPLPGCYEAYIVKLIQDKDFWARTAKAYKDDYNEVIREGPNKKIEQLENQLTASLMRNRELETSGTIAMDKVEKLEGRVVRVFERNEDLREQVIELKDEAIHNEGVMVALKEGYTEANTQVEELFKINLDLRVNQGSTETITNLPCPSHHVTPKMIDEAAKLAEIEKKNRGSELIWIALEELHIFRCEGCKSCCPKCVDQGMQYIRNRPDCNGHGWIIRKEKDDG